MKSSTAKPNIKRSSLPAGLLVSGVRGVNSYVRKHPEISRIAAAMCGRAWEEFGAAAELTLQINHDPEMDDPFLVLYVRLPRYPADTRKRIDAIWQDFEEDLRGLSGWIIATTDFRRVT